MNWKIIVISLFLMIISISAVSATENMTQDTNQEILEEVSQDSIIQSDNAESVSDVKQDLNISVDWLEYMIKPDGSDAYYSFEFKNLPKDYDGRASLYIDGNLTLTQYPEYYSYFNLNRHNLDYGNHIILFEFCETEKYNAMNLTHMLEVTEGFIKIPGVVKDNENVLLGLKYDSKGYLVVNVDGKQYEKVKIVPDDYQSIYVNVPLGGLSKGIHQVEASYYDDSNIKKITKNATVSVEPEISMRICHGYNIYTYTNGESQKHYGADYHNLEVSISKYKTKDIEVFVDDEKFDKVSHLGDEENIYQINLSSLSIGNHTVKITYPGDNRFSPKTIIKNITVIPRIIIPYSTEYNTFKVFLELPKDAKGNLTVYVDDNFFDTKNLVNGFAIVHLNDLKLGNHKIFANYSADDYYVCNVTNSIIINPKISCPLSMKESTNEFLTFEMDYDYNGTFNLTVSDKTNRVPIINGKGNFSLAKLHFYGRDGTPISISFEKEDYKFSDNFDLFIKIPPSFKGGKDITMYYGDYKTYSVQIFDDLGEAASFEYAKIKIGSKTTNVKADAKGFVKIKIKNTPGTYKITTTYRGYKTTNKLVVKHVVTLKSFTVKKSAKSLTLKATLKNKKPMAGKQITFKFNKKTYKAKTDKKGIAKVIVPKKVLNKLKAGKKITYSATYLKDTVKKTVKVRK